MLSDEWLSRYGLLENFNASVTRTRTGTRTGTGTWTTGVTAIALCTSCSRAKNNGLNCKQVDSWNLDCQCYATFVAAMAMPVLRPKETRNLHRSR